MAADAARAKWSRLHNERQWHDGTFKNWARNPSVDRPFNKDHGVTIGVMAEDKWPDDRFLSVEECGPPPTSKPEEVSGGDTS